MTSLSCWLLPTASNPIPSTDTALSHRMPGALERCDESSLYPETIKMLAMILSHITLLLIAPETLT